MKHLQLALTLVAIVALVYGEPPVSKRPMVFHNWPPKNSKQLAMARNPGGKQRTLVVQIRSDQPVPLVFKGRPGYTHNHGHHAHLHHAAGYHHVRPGMARPMKLSAPTYLKAGPMLSKQVLRKPLKLKLHNTKLKSKPATSYEKPFQYELPHTTTTASTASYVHPGELQNLPVSFFLLEPIPLTEQNLAQSYQSQTQPNSLLQLETHAHFISDHFAPIHTIPAPNLALHDNHIHHEDHIEQQQQHHYHSNNHYQVTEDLTNDHTIRDPYSGSQKLFAPDPDPSLPTKKIRPAFEIFNQPSNGKPLPADVQSNYLPPAAQPLVQIVGAQQQQQLQQSSPEIYPIQFTQQQPVAPVPVYSPTYLVTQSNNLYTQHQQQLFKPATTIVEAGYVNADLTQQVASNGQILQAAKDPHNNIHPVLDSTPQFAALIAAPVLGENQNHQQAFGVTAPFRLPNAAANIGESQGGFVVSNFFGNTQDTSQLLQAYAEEEAQQQQLEAKHASLQLQQQQKQYQQLQQEQQHLQQLQLEQEEQQLLLQQQQNHLIELQQLQQQQQHLQQQHQLHQQQQQAQQQEQQQQQQQIQPRKPQKQQQQEQADPAAAAFEEHQRLVQQQLGDTPLRIFVPDDDDASRIQKRSDDLRKGTVENAVEHGLSSLEDSFEVSSSVEVSSENQQDDSRQQD